MILTRTCITTFALFEFLFGDFLNFFSGLDKSEWAMFLILVYNWIHYGDSLRSIAVPERVLPPSASSPLQFQIDASFKASPLLFILLSACT